MKAISMNLDNSIFGTITTVLISVIGLNEIDLISKIVFMGASTLTCLFTCVYTYKKIKNLKKWKDFLITLKQLFLAL
jgi:hypothetical protein